MIVTAGIYSSIVTEAATITEPVLLADAKLWAKVDNSDEDDVIEAMITAARQDIENYLGVKLVDSSVIAFVNVKDEEEEFFQFPSAIRGMIDESSLTVNYLTRGSDDELQAIDEGYFLDHGLSFGATGRYRLEYDIVVEAVPETLKEAIKMLVAYRYNNRGDQEKQQGIPEDVISKIHPYKQIWL